MELAQIALSGGHGWGDAALVCGIIGGILACPILLFFAWLTYK